MAERINSNAAADLRLADTNTTLGATGKMQLKAGATLLAENDLSNPAFTGPTSGGGGRQITIGTVTANNPVAAGTIDQVVLTDGTTPHYTFDNITTTGGGGDFEFNTLEVTLGVPHEITGGTLTAIVTAPV